MNTSGQTMISANASRRHRDTWNPLGYSERDFIQYISEASIIHVKMKIIKFKGNRVSLKNREHINNPQKATSPTSFKRREGRTKLWSKVQLTTKKIVLSFVEKMRATL
jgi:hypothetical protein